MEALENVSTIVGRFAAFWLAPVIGTLSFSFAPTRRLRITTIGVAVLTWLLWLAQWSIWLRAFDEPIPGETVPNSLMAVSDAWMHVTTAACFALVVLTVTMVGVRLTTPAGLAGTRGPRPPDGSPARTPHP